MILCDSYWLHLRSTLSMISIFCCWKKLRQIFKLLVKFSFLMESNCTWLCHFKQYKNIVMLYIECVSTEKTTIVIKLLFCQYLEKTLDNVAFCCIYCLNPKNDINISIFIIFLRFCKFLHNLATLLKLILTAKNF